MVMALKSDTIPGDNCHVFTYLRLDGGTWTGVPDDFIYGDL